MKENNNDVIKITRDLVDINSETLETGELEVGRYIRSYLNGIGLSSELIEFEKGRANVIARIGKGEGLMLNGHMDTVPIGDKSKWKYGPYSVIRDGKMYGRGTSDMKSGIACVLAALSELDLKGSKRKILLTFVAGEEVNLEGSEYLLAKRKEIFKGVKYGIVGEATDLKIQIAQKGATAFKVTFRGKAAHGSKPWLGDSAILKATRFVADYQRLADNFKRKDSLLGKGTVNIGMIRGGTAFNVVPDQCVVYVDRRIIPGESPATSTDDAKRILKKLGIAAEVELTFGRGAFRMSEKSRIVKFVSSATGAGMLPTVPTGYTEVELYKAKAGIDGVVFGPGYKEIIHQANEYVPVKNLLLGKDAMRRIIEKWCFGKPM